MPLCLWPRMFLQVMIKHIPHDHHLSSLSGETEARFQVRQTVSCPYLLNDRTDDELEMSRFLCSN